MQKCKNHDKEKELYNVNEAREELRLWLVKHTDCTVQTGLDKKGKHQLGGWPCGTCTIDFLKALGVNESENHNNPVDRLNEAWRTILQIRGETKA